MSPTSRRILWYWLLLLVPTLLVGTGAIFLLRREQARLSARSADADEARRAAIVARARLIAENVDLLIDDVQTGLLDALAATPADKLDAFLEQWETSNPLVRVTFLSTNDGTFIRPADSESKAEAQGFVRRFRRQFPGQPPWLLTDAARETKEAEETARRQEVAANVAQLQSARRDVQKLVKAREYASVPAPAAKKIEGDARRTAMSRDASMAGAAAPEMADQAMPQLAPQSAERRGWTQFVADGRLHVLGWIQPAGTKQVRGVELELAALISRLASALPAELNDGEGYALRNEVGDTSLQVGRRSGMAEPVVEVPISGALLRDWRVLGSASFATSRSDVNGAMLWVSGMLVAIFVAAILAGGWLLLRQARRSEEEAAQKTSFVANVSHEFKTPLTTIRLYSELLEQGRVQDPARSSEYLRTIGRETQRLARLVNNALDFSRLEQGRKKYALESVDLKAELTRVLETQAPRLAECGMLLSRDFPTAAVVVMTDRDAVEQIVLNLLDNACKYAASGRELTITLTSGKRRGQVEVADRGPGVPAEHRERIFEKFHRVDETLVAEKNGAGLGLSIARQLARGLGGELRYEPRPNGGSLFVLEIP